MSKTEVHRRRVPRTYFEYRQVVRLTNIDTGPHGQGRREVTSFTHTNRVPLKTDTKGNDLGVETRNIGGGRPFLLRDGYTYPCVSFSLATVYL